MGHGDSMALREKVTGALSNIIISQDDNKTGAEFGDEMDRRIESVS